jgi:hypothetical protein
LRNAETVTQTKETGKFAGEIYAAVYQFVLLAGSQSARSRSGVRREPGQDYEDVRLIDATGISTAQAASAAQARSIHSDD